MALEKAVGEFGFPSSTGWQDVVTTLSFTPKVVIVWTVSDHTTTGRTKTDHHRGFFGASDGTNFRCVCWFDQHNLTNDSDSGREWFNTQTINLNNQNNFGPDYAATGLDFSPSTGTGFRINVTNASATGNEKVFYMALGGTDIENVLVQNFQVVTNTAPYTQAITGVGFSPDCVIFASAQTDGASGANINEAKFSLGWSDFTNNFFISGTTEDATSAPHPMGAIGNDACVVRQATGDGASVTGKAHVDTKIAGGFNLDITDTFSAQWQQIMIAIKGPQFKAGFFDAPTVSATDIDQSSACGFQPEALWLMGINHAGSWTDGTNNMIIQIGATDGTTEKSVSGASDFEANPTDTSGVTDTTAIYTHEDFNNNNEGYTNFKQWDANGFTLTRTVATGDPKADRIPWLAIGPAATDKVGLVNGGLVNNNPLVSSGGGGLVT